MAHCSGTRPASWKLEKEGKCGQVGDGDWGVDRQSLWMSTWGWMVDGQHSSKEALGYLFPPTRHGQGRTWQAYERVAPRRVRLIQ